MTLSNHEEGGSIKSIQYANNDQLVYAIKTYNELTTQEKDALTIPATNI